MHIIKDFQDFALKGNAVEMAVGIVVGGAFGKIVASLVSDIIMPPIGKLVGAVQFTSLFINLGEQTYPSLEAAKAAGAPTLNYGAFVQSCVDFFIVAFCMFLVVRSLNAMRKKREPKPLASATLSEEIVLLRQIRDALQKY